MLEGLLIGLETAFSLKNLLMVPILLKKTIYQRDRYKHTQIIHQRKKTKNDAEFVEFILQN